MGKTKGRKKRIPLETCETHKVTIGPAQRLVDRQREISRPADEPLPQDLDARQRAMSEKRKSGPPLADDEAGGVSVRSVATESGAGEEETEVEEP